MLERRKIVTDCPFFVKCFPLSDRCFGIRRSLSVPTPILVDSDPIGEVFDLQEN